MSLILNIAPIQFQNSEITIEEFDYSDEKRTELFNLYRATHLIKRQGQKLVTIPLDGSEHALGGIISKINLAENLGIVTSLARQALFHRLTELDCWISGMTPISYLVKRNNILSKSIGQNVTKVEGFGVYPKWEIDFRIHNPTGEQTYIGVSINVRTTPRISLTCKALLDLGVPILGYYAGKISYSKNKELKPHFSAIGRITGIEGEYLRLDDLRDETEPSVLASECYLEPREDVLVHCLKHVYGTEADAIISALDYRTSEYHHGEKKLKKLTEALRSFQGFSLELLPGIQFKIGNYLSSTGTGMESTKIGKADNSTFVFAPGGQKVNSYNDVGLTTYGPYSREFFTPSKPRICVICQVGKKGQVEQIVRKFLDGIEPVGYGTEGKTFTFTGLKTKYHLLGCSVEFFTALNDTHEAYNKAISDALKAHGSDSGNFDLALVQIDAGFRNRFISENPYFLAKARFIGQQIPVQEFTLEALSLPNERVMWTLNNMALATYVKLGGVPWLLKANRPMVHELVFGIGSASISSSRFGGKERMIGITTVFTGDGNYFVSNVSSAVPADEYFDTFLDNLKLTIDRIKKDFNWQPKDSIRLVFHAFKVFKNKEAEAVKAVISELGDYNVEYAFVHVAQDHPYFLFDSAQRGVTKVKKGIFAPRRGQLISLADQRNILVTLTGPYELKKSSDGLPSPIQLRLHHDSTFTDLNYLANQVVNFSAHSWRSFQPAHMPVTVYYSQLVAQLLGQLSGVSSWNPDSILNKIGTTRWFL